MNSKSLAVLSLLLSATSCRTTGPISGTSKSMDGVTADAPEPPLNPSKCGMTDSFICKSGAAKGEYTVTVDTVTREAIVSFKKGRKDVTYPKLECIANNGPFPAPGAEITSSGAQEPIPEFTCWGNIDQPTVFGDFRQMQIDFACDPAKSSSMTLNDAKVSLMSNAEDINVADNRKDFKCSAQPSSDQ